MPGLPDIGQIVGGDFRILAPLGQGGMGAVFVAEQVSIARRRALKVMRPELLHDARLRERFVQEAKIGASIESAHVVEVVGAGIDEALGVPWIAMELLEGRDLAALVAERGALPPNDVRELLDQLCHAVGAAHRASVVHRDLKPENVFVAKPRRSGVPFEVKVLDFGIAKVVAEARGTIATSGASTAALGTPLWMAPEQAESKKGVTPAADVWAIGLIAFRALTGRFFWKEANDANASITSLLREVLIDPIPSANVRATELGVQHLLPPNFDAWFGACVAREPTARFGDATAAWNALAPMLAQVQQGPSLLASTIAAVSAPVISETAFAPTRPAPPTTIVTRRSKTPWIVGATLLALVGAATAGVLLLRDDDAAARRKPGVEKGAKNKAKAAASEAAENDDSTSSTIAPTPPTIDSTPSTATAAATTTHAPTTSGKTAPSSGASATTTTTTTKGKALAVTEFCKSDDPDKCDDSGAHCTSGVAFLGRCATKEIVAHIEARFERCLQLERDKCKPSSVQCTRDVASQAGCNTFCNQRTCSQPDLPE